MEQGFEGLTIDAVARRAGSSRSTIYRWWSSPGELVLSALEARLGRDVPQPDTGVLAGDLTAFLSHYAATAADERAGLWAALVHTLSRDPQMRAEVLQRLIDHGEVAVLRRIVEQAQVRGEVAPHVDPFLARETLWSLLSMRTSAATPCSGASARP